MYRQIILPWLGILLLMAGCTVNQAARHNQLSRAEENQGWQLLFKGKNLDGWHGYGHTAISKAWVVKDGCILLDAAMLRKKLAGGDLVSDKSFGQFHLKYEWKIAAGGNSGLIFFINEDTSLHKYTFSSGPEMQVLDNDRHAEGRIPTHRAGDLFDLQEALPLVHPAGQWNLAEIKVHKGLLQFFLNHRLVLQTTLWDTAWKNKIANSKFKNWPAFGSYQSGNIALQEHGDTVWFRNIKIKMLP